MGNADGKTPNAMEGILSMILANMASTNGAIVNMNSPEKPLVNNQNEVILPTKSKTDSGTKINSKELEK